MIVVDEADLVLSFGFEKDLETIAKSVPKICQAFLMSATLNEVFIGVISGELTTIQDVQNMKKLMLHTPVILRMEEQEEEGGTHLIEYSAR